MIGLQAVGVYVPEHRIDNVARAPAFEREASFITDKVGFQALPRVPAEMQSSDMCVRAFEDLRRRADVELDQVDCVVVCTQNPDGAGLPHTAAIVQHKLGLADSVAAFDISLGCSGYVYALGVVQAFMAAQGLKRGLLFTADPYSKVLDETDLNTELLFGDAATCSLLTDTPRYHTLKSRFSTDGSRAAAIMVNPGSRKISMDGKGVFAFTLLTVPKQIALCLEDNGLTAEDVDVFVLHQATRYVIDNMRKKLKLPAEKVPFHASQTGNTVSSTIPLVLADLWEADHDTLLLCGFGVGLSWASTVLKRAR